MHLNIPQKLDAIVQPILKAKKIALVITSLVMAITFFLVVIMRYIFEADLFAYEEWILVFAFWLYFLGGAVGSYENSHIKADFLQTLLKTARAKWLLINTTLFLEVIICSVLTYWAFLMIQEEYTAYPEWQRTSALQIPFIAPRFGIFVGLFFMTFYSLLHLYSNLRSGPTPEIEDKNPLSTSN